MVDFEQIAAQARQIPGVKVELIPVASAAMANQKIEIGNLLNKPLEQTSEDTNIVSREPAKYKDKQGTLIRFADGTVVFQFDKEANGRQVQIRYKFENENDFKKEQPSKAESFRKVKDGNGFRYEKNGEETYKYHRNGKIAHTEYKNAKGKTISYDKVYDILEKVFKNGTIGNLIQRY